MLGMSGPPLSAAGRRDAELYALALLWLACDMPLKIGAASMSSALLVLM
jgi:hypothetical protein